jgi:DMSO/TMAO reductase YedYZ heme-binding membrane subunit
LVAYALLTVTVVNDLLLSTKVLPRRRSQPWLFDWHRFVGGLAIACTVLHMAAVWIDDYIEFTVLDLLVPFVSPWRPTALAFGIVGLYLLLAVELTSLARRRLPTQLWRRVHYLSPIALVAATGHLLLAGEDADEPTVLLSVGCGVGVTASLTVLWVVQMRPG